MLSIIKPDAGRSIGTGLVLRSPDLTQAQYQVMTSANVERNILFWNIGNVLLQYSQWGNKFVETLSRDLRMTYLSREGYSVRNLNYMKQFARRIPSEEILHQGGAN